MPTNISWASETLNVIVAQAWACECGWIGRTDQLIRSLDSATKCPQCRSGALKQRTGWHCERVSSGCGGGCASPEYSDLVQLGERPAEAKGGCYAESMNELIRWGRGTGLPYIRSSRERVDISLDEQTLRKPLFWKKPRIVFVNSMTDTFAEFVTDDWRDQMLAVMALTPQHRYLLLTKRAEGMYSYFKDQDELRMRIGAAAGCLLDGDWIWHEGKRFRPAIERLISASLGVDHDDEDNEIQIEALQLPLKNVFLGVSCENQETANDRIPWLLSTPAALRWVSAEPLLGPVDLRAVVAHDGDGPAHDLTWIGEGAGIDYAVIGAESGTGYRKMELKWLTDLAAQCQTAGVPIHVKQDAGLYPGQQGRIPDNLWALKAIAGENHA